MRFSWFPPQRKPHQIKIPQTPPPSRAQYFGSNSTMLLPFFSSLFPPWKKVAKWLAVAQFTTDKVVLPMVDPDDYDVELLQLFGRCGWIQLIPSLFFVILKFKKTLAYWTHSEANYSTNSVDMPEKTKHTTIKTHELFGRHVFLFVLRDLPGSPFQFFAHLGRLPGTTRKHMFCLKGKPTKISPWWLLWNQDVSRSLLISLTTYMYSNNDTYVFLFRLRTLHICSPQVPKWLWKCNITLFTYTQHGTWIYIYIYF